MEAEEEESIPQLGHPVIRGDSTRRGEPQNPIYRYHEKKKGRTPRKQKTENRKTTVAWVRVSESE